jgi:hypothetical protein
LLPRRLTAGIPNHPFSSPSEAARAICTYQ